MSRDCDSFLVRLCPLVFTLLKGRGLVTVVPLALLLCCRLPNRPVINTPVVSVMVHSEGAPPSSPPERPILVEFALLETEERTKPVCVFWNHSLE